MWRARSFVFTLYVLQQFLGVTTEQIASGSPSPQARRERYTSEVTDGSLKSYIIPGSCKDTDNINVVLFSVKCEIAMYQAMKAQDTVEI
jgi:hypothetical protein